MKEQKLRQIVLEEVNNFLTEETSITTVADVAIAKFMDTVQKIPSIADNVDKLKVEPSGSFFSIILYDKRGNKVELARTPVQEVAKRLLPQIQDGIVKIVKTLRKNIGSKK